MKHHDFVNAIVVFSSDLCVVSFLFM